MAERITVEVVRAEGKAPPLIFGTGEDIDSAMAAFDAKAADANLDRFTGKLVMRAVLTLDAGTVTIAGAPGDGYDDANSAFTDAKAEYMAGPGWGGI